jgi:hypothetical protein
LVRRRIVGVFKPPLLRRRSDTPCAAITDNVIKLIQPGIPSSDDRGRILRADPLEAKLSAILAEFAKNLAALVCDERRALSRRKFALRAFALARVETERRAPARERRASAGWGKAIEAAVPSFARGAALSEQQP